MSLVWNIVSGGLLNALIPFSPHANESFTGGECP